MMHHTISIIVQFIKRFQTTVAAPTSRTANMPTSPSVFYADAVLFDMDGTLTDSIAAVEAAWAKVAKDIGQDPAHVISSTHGKRAIDNLSEFKPHIKESDIEAEVARFEESILFYADAYHKSNTPSVNANSSTTINNNNDLDANTTAPSAESDLESHDNYNLSVPIPMSTSQTITPINNTDVIDDGSTPALTPGSTAPTSRRSSIAQSAPEHDIESGSNPYSTLPSLGSRLFNVLNNAIRSGLIRTPSSASDADDVAIATPDDVAPIQVDIDMGIEHEYDGIPNIIVDSAKSIDKRAVPTQLEHDIDEAWKLEAATVDRSVRILPGVRALIDSIPEGRYAVATSGAKTYAYGCMSRVGITPPKITITADDKRLKAGKPAPDPFILAAKCLGYDPSNCVVFEDSPSGIKSGLASGATVVAVCTSHEKAKLESCGAHYLLDTMESIKCEVDERNGKLRFEVMSS